MYKSLEELKNKVLERPEQLREECLRGGIPVGYFCNYVPEELIHAARLIPIRLAYGGEKEPEIKGGEYITDNSCSYAKACIGYRASGKDPLFLNIDYIAEAPACVQMEWVLETFERYFGVNIIPIGLPRKFDTEGGFRYYLRELLDFKRELEEIGRREISEDDLKNSIELYNSIRDNLRWIYELLKEDDPPISWNEAFELVQAGFILDREMYLQIIKLLLEEVKLDKSHNAKGEDKDRKRITAPAPRILIMGSIMAFGDKKILDTVSDLGANIVIDELCTGSRWFWDKVEDLSLEGLARRYLLKTPCATLPDTRRDGNVRREQLERLIEDYGVDGVIYYTLRFCDAYSFKVERDREWLTRMGIPMLHINSDYSSASKGQMRTRIEAFLELLHYKIIN